jgi:hypothetical protein
MMLVEVTHNYDAGPSLEVRKVGSGDAVEGEFYVLPDEAVKAFWGAREIYEEAEAAFVRILQQAKDLKGGE